MTCPEQPEAAASFNVAISYRHTDLPASRAEHATDHTLIKGWMSSCKH